MLCGSANGCPGCRRDYMQDVIQQLDEAPYGPAYEQQRLAMEIDPQSTAQRATIFHSLQYHAIIVIFHVKDQMAVPGDSRTAFYRAGAPTRSAGQFRRGLASTRKPSASPLSP